MHGADYDVRGREREREREREKNYNERGNGQQSVVGRYVLRARDGEWGGGRDAGCAEAGKEG